MSQYTPIDCETLLVERANPVSEIHFGFYDSHVMNIIDSKEVYGS